MNSHDFIARRTLRRSALAGCALASMGACSSSDSAGAAADADAPPGVVDAGPPASATGCEKNALKVLFSPMYSAYDGVHTFEIPAVVTGLDQSVITWTASDMTMVGLAQDTATGGVMITTLKPGTVSIIASAGGLCGSSPLTIAAASADDWELGSARYNDNVVLTVPTGPGMNGAGAADGGVDAAASQEAACTNCHGPTANNVFKTVSHTPEQTGGFSDEDLKNIFRNGTVPKGGYFDSSIVPYAAWQGFHKWQMTDDQARGIIVYLRALTPQAQTGQSNFGGMFMRGDGGAPPPPVDDNPDAGP